MTAAVRSARANRDEREYPEPNKFIWNRPIRRQLAFGLGLHHCLGLHITRLQIRVCVEEFLKRIPEFSLDLSRPVTWSEGTVRGPRNLPLVIG